MITLVMSRHRQRRKFQHDTFSAAARNAVSQLNHDMAWPVKIMENNETLWEHDGPFGDAIEQLRDIAAREAAPRP